MTNYFNILSNYFSLMPIEGDFSFWGFNTSERRKGELFLFLISIQKSLMGWLPNFIIIAFSRDNKYNNM